MEYLNEIEFHGTKVTLNDVVKVQWKEAYRKKQYIGIVKFITRNERGKTSIWMGKRDGKELSGDDVVFDVDMKKLGVIVTIIAGNGRFVQGWITDSGFIGIDGEKKNV